MKKNILIAGVVGLLFSLIFLYNIDLEEYYIEVINYGYQGEDLVPVDDIGISPTYITINCGTNFPKGTIITVLMGRAIPVTDIDFIERNNISETLRLESDEFTILYPLEYIGLSGYLNLNVYIHDQGEFVKNIIGPLENGPEKGRYSTNYSVDYTSEINEGYIARKGIIYRKLLVKKEP